MLLVDSDKLLKMWFFSIGWREVPIKKLYI